MIWRLVDQITRSPNHQRTKSPKDLIIVFSMPLRALVVAALTIAALSASLSCRGGKLIRQYEYEEDMYLELDGSATVVVNASLPALVALRGLTLPSGSSARLDRQAARQAYESPVTRVATVSRPWRRHGRRFIQIRVEVNDIRRLPTAAPFSWSEYALSESGEGQTYRQVVRGAPATVPSWAGWDGSEIVAFRLHLPSVIRYHNVRDIDTGAARGVDRGNILTWEQRLTDRLAAKPLEIEARMDRRSILRWTLLLFAGAFGAAVFLLGGIVWWTSRRRAPRERASV
jgi:hypothetical protein